MLIYDCPGVRVTVPRIAIGVIICFKSNFSQSWLVIDRSVQLSSSLKYPLQKNSSQNDFMTSIRCLQLNRFLAQRGIYKSRETTDVTYPKT